MSEERHCPTCGDTDIVLTPDTPVDGWNELSCKSCRRVLEIGRPGVGPLVDPLWVDRSRSRGEERAMGEAELIAQTVQELADVAESHFLPIIKQRDAEIDRLRKALRFYADPIRYGGANQRNDADDPYSAGAPYIKDVGRDNGDLARAALSSTECNPTGNIEDGA